jgi:hypothetical protein
MPDDPSPKLVSYYDYAATRFRHPRSGEPFKKRAVQLIAQRYRLPLIRVGNCTLVDPDAADAVLRGHALFGPDPNERRGRASRGRPRARLDDLPVRPRRSRLV